MKSGTDVANRLLHEAHVAVVPGEAFGTTQHVRLSYATSEEVIRKGLERMKKFFGNL
jgi:aspartate aminotransferase